MTANNLQNLNHIDEIIKELSVADKEYFTETTPVTVLKLNYLTTMNRDEILEYFYFNANNQSECN